MIWVVVVALIASLGLNALFAVLLSRQSNNTTTVLDRAHARTTEYTEGLVDRIISGDYQTYKAYELMGGPPMPGIEIEEEPTVEAVHGPDKGGFGSRLGLAAYRPPELDIAEMEAELPG